MNARLWLAACTSLCASSVYAEVAVAKPDSDADNYKNDAVKFEVPLTVQRLRLGDGADPKPACVPANSDLYGLGKVMIAAGAGKAPEQRALFQVRKVDSKASGCNAAAADAKDKPVAEGDVVALAPGTLDTHHRRRGWTYGALTVPFKYQLRGERGQSGGAALGGYLGGRFWWSGASNQFVGFVGLTKVDVPVVKDGKPSTDEVAGISYGLGLLTTVKGSFQAGIVLGFDHVSRSAGYAYNDKPWISVSFGHTFTN